MFEFLNYILTPANIEIVCLLILGTLFQMADGSPFQITKKLDAVWSTDLPREYFSPIVQHIIKTGLSIIVAARCGATYPYTITAMLVIFCLLKDRTPKLMLPWIFVAGVKSIGMTFAEALIGVYVCSAFGKIHKACIEFLISKALEIIFAAYLWGSVLSVYQDMERRLEHERIRQNPAEIAFIKKMDFKRKRARSLLDEATLYKTACLNNFEFKDVPRIILQMLRRANEMSQDSLLGPGMMLASVSNMGSFDNLKTSESLGELGYTNLQTTKVIGLDEEENLSPPEKALKFLKMTWSDVKRVQQSVSYEDKDIPSLRSDSWIQVTMSDAQIYKPKQARTEIYIRELPEVEPDEDIIFKGKNKKKIYDIKLGISLFNLIKKNSEEEELFAYTQEETEEEEEEEDEEEEDEELSKIFMSNIKDEKPVNRIGLNIRQAHYKGLAYYKLYKKDYMSVIGPEVFERATKLRKVTSLTLPKLMSKTASRNNSSIMSDAKLQPEPSGENLSEKNENSRENINISPRVQKTVEIEENLKSTDIMKSKFEAKPQASLNRSQEKLPIYLKTQPSHKETVEVQKGRPPCYKKRRIRIKWIGNLKCEMNCVSTSSSFSNKSDDFSDFQHSPETDSDENIPPKKTKISPINAIISIAKKKDKINENHNRDRDVYFLMELLHKPLPEILGKYYDLRDIVYTRRKTSSVYKKEFEVTDNLYRMYILEKFKEMRATGEKDYKIWKSKVLKIAEANQEPITGDFLNKIDQDVVSKLLRYQYFFLQRKMKENGNVSNTSLQVDAENIKNNRGQCLIQLSTSKSKNELCCRSHSENIYQSRETFKENNNKVIYSNEGNFSETPSEHSIEVCHKDLNNGQLYNSEQTQNPFEDSSKDEEELKTLEEFLETAEDGSLCSQESDEPISLYYSKAANLASPLLDMKKFIYPDHIHYSYKHVNKKGFDVNISGDLPLLVQSQALAKNKNLHVKKIPSKPEPEITKRPMDLSFAKTNAFADWQNSDQNVSDFPMQSNANFNGTKTKPSNEETNKRKKGSSKEKENNGRNSQNGTSFDSHHVYFSQTSTICENLSTESSEKDIGRSPVQISSTQLHSNKGRISSTYNPALRLQENKREGKKKAEAQEKHAKDMLASLEKEIFFQNKNGFNSNKP